MASKLSKWFKKNKWAMPLGVGALALAAPWAAGAMMGGGAGAAGAGAGAAGAAGAGAGAGAAGASIPLASGYSLAGPVAASAPTLGSGGTFMGGLSNMLAAHPGWTGALKGAGSYGLEQGASYLNPPAPQQQVQMPPGWDRLSGFDGDVDEPTKQQLARLQAYFSGRYGGGGYNA